MNGISHIKEMPFFDDVYAAQTATAARSFF